MNSKRLLVKAPFLSAALLLVALAGTATAQIGIIINGNELTGRQATAMAAVCGPIPPAGIYWYDMRSGAWGFEGKETAGFIMPGHNFGPLSPNASRGNTGVYINGRQLNAAEVTGLQRLLGTVYRGRWWLDGRTGCWGVEGEAQPRGNILSAMRTQRRDGDNFWSGRLGRGNSDGDCGYINAGGTTVGTGSCR
jgi:hypothetical protein